MVSNEPKLVFAFYRKFGDIYAIHRFRAERVNVLPQAREFAVYVGGVFPVRAHAQSNFAAPAYRKLFAKLRIRVRGAIVYPNPLHKTFLRA
jgi:hypothetical protein